MIDIAVIGGGAAGMMAAISAKKARPSLSVAVFERQSRVGRKLLATGNGRCNITNARCEDNDIYNNAFASRVIARAGLERVLSDFRAMGLNCVFDREGRAYPESDQAAGVVDALRLTLDELGVEVLTGREVKTVAKLSDGFRLAFISGETVQSRRVIVACGGKAGEKLGGCSSGYDILRAFGHKITPLAPALTQLRCDPALVRALKGIKRQCDIALEIDGETVQAESGEVLFCDYGLSGIASMALSLKAGRAISSGKSAAAILRVSAITKSELLLRAKLLGKRQFDDFLSGMMPKRLGQQLLKLSGISPLSRECETLSIREAASLANNLNAWRLPLTGVNGFSDAQVTGGGADVTQFTDSLESKLVSGLFAVGETLDVDGPCGGFNLNWAWASGIVAGEASGLGTARGAAP